jgi:hypothetical protein
MAALWFQVLDRCFIVLFVRPEYSLTGVQISHWTILGTPSLLEDDIQPGVPERGVGGDTVVL